jgi:hypothetical protein
MLTNILLSQQINDTTYINKNWSYGKCYKMPNNKPKNWKPPTNLVIKNLSKRFDSNIYREPSEQPPIKPCSQDCGDLKAGIQVQIGNSFEGNHQGWYNPLDNTIAISNDGLIVSVDNGTVAYFKENGDTIAKFGLPWSNFYSDTSIIANNAFDPRVIYDRYENRFILLTLYKNASDSRMIISFSDSLISDTVTWNHYYIHCDSVFTGIDEEGYWFDYPNIAINKDELFIESKVEDDIFNNRSTILFQIKKQDGYLNLPTIQKKVWKNILNADGDPAKNVVPLSDGLQLDSYNNKLYLVSNNSINSSRLFWYELNGNIDDTTATITSTFILSPVYYSVASYASQMGGSAGDRISIYDNEILSGYHQNGKLHFTYHRSDNGWMEVVYNKIDISNNTINTHTWGGDGTNKNYMFPAVACFGVDSTDENAMIAFQRTGPSTYIELCVVNYDNGWSPQTTVIKEGVGLLDQTIYDGTSNTYERFGDYIDIQRRYNNQSCWVAGQFAFDSTGTSANHFGQTNGVNTWIAEIGDVGVGINEIEKNNDFSIYPNPLRGNKLNITSIQNASISKIVLTDVLGKTILFTQNKIGDMVTLNLPKGLNGIYFLTIQTKTNNYETHKIIINN